MMMMVCNGCAGWRMAEMVECAASGVVNSSLTGLCLGGPVIGPRLLGSCGTLGSAEVVGAKSLARCEISLPEKGEWRS